MLFKKHAKHVGPRIGSDLKRSYPLAYFYWEYWQIRHTNGIIASYTFFKIKHSICYMADRTCTHDFLIFKLQQLSDFSFLSCTPSV
jgi:hypothetical protein